ncbi:hypothetical protein [Actinoplanes xinjiangensis]|uniref:hypothetical protein n=1 Tax=Actinoplanes xinjiangensis TaxID=512350 RepID=UPI00343405A4
MDLSTTAYLAAGLQRAASANGVGPATLGDLADKSLINWKAWALRDSEGSWVSYEVTLNIPVVSGGTVELPLCGRVRDVCPRRASSKELPAGWAIGRGAAAENIFAKGLPVDAVVTADCNRKTLLMRYIVPWLVEHKISTRGTRSALIDHPFPEVRQVLYTHVTGTDLPQLAAFPAAWRAHIGATYLDADLQWGFAACPDDTTLVQQIVATLSSVGRGLEIASIARHAEAPAKAIRAFVAPAHRYGVSFDRPIYLTYADAEKTQIEIIRCPHDCPSGRCDVVALLPEVAASGFGVICSSCWRTPNIADPKWAKIVFPSSYGTPVTRVAEAGPLRIAPQTIFSPAVTPMAILPPRPPATDGH